MVQNPRVKQLTTRTRKASRILSSGSTADFCPLFQSMGKASYSCCRQLFSTESMRITLTSTSASSAAAATTTTTSSSVRSINRQAILFLFQSPLPIESVRSQQISIPQYHATHSIPRQRRRVPSRQCWLRLHRLRATLDRWAQGEAAATRAAAATFLNLMAPITNVTTTEDLLSYMTVLSGPLPGINLKAVITAIVNNPRRLLNVRA